MTDRGLVVVILAAGKGTRMRSSRAKVVHEIAGQSMLRHVMDLSRQLRADRLAVVIGPDQEEVRADASTHALVADGHPLDIFVQQQQLGTGDALKAAGPAIESIDDVDQSDVLVLYGDTPLLTAGTLQAVRGTLNDGAHVTVLGFHADDPTGYGRLLVDSDGGLMAIREHKDASDEERAVTFCNSGVMGFRAERLLELLDTIDNNNANGEYYLTDMVGKARAAGLPARAVTCSEDEVLGVNDRMQLAQAEALLQARLRAKAMAGGVTVVAPDTVFMSFDTRFGQDVVVEPNVFFAPGVEVAAGARIRANSYIEDAKIGAGAVIGPYARVRPGTDVGAGSRIGNFVEVKNAQLSEGVKINHLTYVGDSDVGTGANIGAGTITCNYDGFFKHRTVIGAGAFIGSNSSLVAPVNIGDDAYVGSGSVITKDIQPGSLGLTRAKQEERVGWARKFRSLMMRQKEKARP